MDLCFLGRFRSYHSLSMCKLGLWVLQTSRKNLVGRLDRNKSGSLLIKRRA